jgi:hypothetical protein
LSMQRTARSGLALTAAGHRALHGTGEARSLRPPTPDWQ